MCGIICVHMNSPMVTKTLSGMIVVKTMMMFLVIMVTACGDGNKPITAECIANGLACTDSGECCTQNCDSDQGVCTRLAGVCAKPGDPCTIGPDCCSYSCTDFTCSEDQCISDGESCSGDESCCSGTCTDGLCEALNETCKTSGNSCESEGDCCSKYCVDTICSAAPSFCSQSGDICTNDDECCGGLCQIEEGKTLGTCQLTPASGAGSCLSAGEVCGGIYDGEELPVCGGECCSRACLPYGPSGVLVCQAPSGCRPTGETCRSDDDCCGSANNPDGEKSNVTCSKEGDNPIGRCDAGNSCTPAGGICRLQTNSCNANANCCAGNVLQEDTCKLDSVGIPRCVAATIDCSNPSEREGEECATSADCCGLPCTPSGSGQTPLLCGGTQCVASGGACTTASDCCAGLPCHLAPGSTDGVCGDTAGSCSEFGQSCTNNTDCCNNLICLDGGVCGSTIIVE